MKEFFAKHWKTILIIAIVALAIWYFFLRKKKPATTGSGYAASAFPGQESGYGLPFPGAESNFAVASGVGIKTPAGTATGQPLPATTAGNGTMATNTTGTNVANKTYVFKCTSADGKSATSGISSKPYGNCPAGYKEVIMKTIG